MSSPIPDDEVRAAFSEAFGSAPRSWLAEPLAPDAVAGATKQLARVHGDDRSLVLKVLTSAPRGHERWSASADVAHPYYWKREALAYRSPAIASLGAVRPPEVFGIFERASDEVGMWLEDVSGEPATRWTAERYGTAARHLGRAQGRIAKSRALPPEPWWSREWLREYLARHEPASVDAGGAATTAALMLPEEMLAQARRLWSEREWFLAMLDRIPRTLCHLDTWTPNLFADDGRATVLIDWAYAGIGALCEDVANMFPDAFLDGFVPNPLIDVMETQIVEGYRSGLRDVGLDLDADLVRLGFTAAAAIKYVWMVPHMFGWAADPAADQREVTRVVAARLPIMTRLFELADEARILARAAGI